MIGAVNVICFRLLLSYVEVVALLIVDLHFLVLIVVISCSGFRVFFFLCCCRCCCGCFRLGLLWLS